MKKISKRILIDFTSGLSMLLEAGLTVSDSVRMLGSFGKNRRMAELVSRLDEGLKKGTSLSDLITGESTPFPPVYCGLVSIGEQTGSLNRVLPALASYLEREKKIRDRIINSSIYPGIVMIMTILGMIFLTAFILPRLETIFASLVDSEEQIRDINRNIGIITAVIVMMISAAPAILFLFLAGRKSDSIKSVAERTILKIPGFRRLISDTNIYSFMFALEILTERGVPLSRAIETAGDVCSSLLFRRAVKEIHGDLKSGLSLASAFSRQNVFPGRVVSWVGIGENTGKADRVFGQIRIYYESEIENLSSRFMGIVEPVMIILVGGVIILLIITFIVPLISLFGSVI